MINQFRKSVSVLLFISILVYSLGFIYQFIIGFLLSGLTSKLDPNFPSLVYFPTLSTLSILNIYFVFAILKFKKIGFLGFIITQLIILISSLFIQDWIISITYFFIFLLVLIALEIDKKNYKWA